MIARDGASARASDLYILATGSCRARPNVPAFDVKGSSYSQDTRRFPMSQCCMTMMALQTSIYLQGVHAITGQ